MLTPNVDLGRRFVDRNKPPGRLLLCGVTGSHHYGFPSPDSDLDLKGIHLRPTEDFLGLETPQDSFERLEVFDGTECDFTSNELKQALGLLLKGNGNMLERIKSPYQLYVTPELNELRALADGAMSQQLYRHYSGFFRQIRSNAEVDGEVQTKTLLYAYRVSLTGVHLLREGKVVVNVFDSAPPLGFPEVLDLAARKHSAAEKAVLPADEAKPHLLNLQRLDDMLTAAKEGSPLPEHPQNHQECVDWLLALRRRDLAG